ncbi:hypothetical protein LJB71_08190 [Thermomonas sp. S9]|uniref:hypothetical protein n=1 Tax=Thermomonas sp. S9 TaxID=2885203 RepID=UPI00216B3B18|nr:hypothetical protein [Thermomonas sp. S9]MCR6496194.1 hypothetical protein [Thermomonas sp. S9]
MTDKNAIGVVIGVIGLAICTALALAMQLIQPYMPAVRGFLLWMCDPRMVIGMVFGMAVMAAIVWCVLADESEDWT